MATEKAPSRFLLQQRTYNLTSLGFKRIETGFYINPQGDFQPIARIIDDAEKSHIDFHNSEFFLYMVEFHKVFTGFLNGDSRAVKLKDMLGLKTKLKTADKLRGVEIQREGESISLFDSTLSRFIQLRHVVSASLDRLEKMRDLISYLVNEYAQIVYDRLPADYTASDIEAIISVTDWDECEDLTMTAFTHNYDTISLNGNCYTFETPYLLAELTVLYRDYISEIVRMRLTGNVTKRTRMCDDNDKECREFMNHRRFTQFY